MVSPTVHSKQYFKYRIYRRNKWMDTNRKGVWFHTSLNELPKSGSHCDKWKNILAEFTPESSSGELWLNSNTDPCSVVVLCVSVAFIKKMLRWGNTETGTQWSKKMTGLIISIPVHVRATVITGISFLNKTSLTGKSVDLTISLTAWPVDRLTGK